MKAWIEKQGTSEKRIFLHSIDDLLFVGNSVSSFVSVILFIWKKKAFIAIC